MGELTKIQWTDHTFNPWIGCTKVSPGCANCYAEEMMDKRYGKARWGKGQPRQRTSEANWKQPLRWNRSFVCSECSERQVASPVTVRDMKCYTCGAALRQQRVFCASLADWLDDEAPIEWLADLLNLIHDTPNLDWLLLTKRPENWWSRIESAADYHFDQGDRNVAGWLYDWMRGTAPAHVWVGASAEDQPRANERIPELIKIPAKVRFLSVEPMLGPVDLRLSERWEISVLSHRECDTKPAHLHWIIFGGESGPRLCNVEWIRDGVRQCREAGVAPFVKQLGAKPFEEEFVHAEDCWNDGCALAGGPEDCDGEVVHEEWTLRDKKGGDPSEWPEDLRVREFPHV